MGVRPPLTPLEELLEGGDAEPRLVRGSAFVQLTAA